MGEIIMAHQTKVETALAEVQRQDAEFDAKVVAAQRSCSIVDDSEAPYETNETDSADAQERLQNFVKAEESILRVPHRAAMESLEAKQPDAIPIPFDSQPEYGPVGNAVDVESIPNDNLSSQTLTASSPKETDAYPLKYPRSCWRVTQSMKRTCRKTIKATRKAGSICYSRCTSMLCFS